MKKTVLVVDDEVSNTEILSLILQEEGYEVLRATNGREGLERVAQEKPELVVLDYMMPVMNGAEMGAALRKSEAGRRIGILMNSSLPEESVRAEFDGFDAFLRKPYDIDEMLALIARLIGGRSSDH